MKPLSTVVTLPLPLFTTEQNFSWEILHNPNRIAILNILWWRVPAGFVDQERSIHESANMPQTHCCDSIPGESG